MGEDSLTLGYLMGQEGKGGNGFGDGFGGLWGIILAAMILGYGGYGGGLFGGGGGGQALTRAELYDGFATQNIDSAVRGVQQGICDSTYALNSAITGGFYGLQSQLADCCCQTQRAVDGVNFNMAKGFCDIGNVINMQPRDIIDNQNANAREIINFLTQDKISTLTAENQSLKFAASQAQQNAVIRAAIDASTAEIIRRTGNDCPTPAYWVSPPTPVAVPCNSGCGCGV